MAYWVDDGIDTWPESIRAGRAAMGLYLLCGAWISRGITNGTLAEAVVPVEVATMYGTREWIARLVSVGLWEHVEDGYADRRYHAMGNPTAEKAAKAKAAKKARQEKWLAKAREKQRNSRRSRDASQDESKDLAPSLPPSKEGKGERAPASQGAAHAPPEDPRVIAQAEEELRLKTEAAVMAIAEHQQRTARGAAAARAAIPKRSRADPTRNGLAALNAAVADLPPPAGDPPEEPLAAVVPIRPAPAAETSGKDQA